MLVSTTTMTRPTATRPRRGKRGRRREVRLLGWAGGNDGSISWSDVDMDNGPPGLSQTLPGLGTQRAEVRESVNARRMAAFEGDLERVLPDECYVFDAQLLGAQRLDPGETAGCPHLTATLSARTRPSKLLGGVSDAVAVFPRDLHRLACSIDIDVDRKRIGILQRSGA